MATDMILFPYDFELLKDEIIRQLHNHPKAISEWALMITDQSVVFADAFYPDKRQTWKHKALLVAALAVIASEANL